MKLRQLSQKELENLTCLTENSVEAALIQPTATGLGKSIMDATEPVRRFLKNKRLHDFSAQKQGPENKATIASFLVEANGQKVSMASLYRPNTKKGDPRIWFSGLPSFARPDDILAVFTFENRLYVINLTSTDIDRTLKSPIISPLREIVTVIKNVSNATAAELLGLLKKLAQRGPIPALLAADTAVGRTLETLLGIQINSSQKPDFKGIEIKSFRENRGNRKNLFTQVPDWGLSKLKSSAEILGEFGYSRGDDFKLYCTVSTRSANSQGLTLRLNDEKGQLLEFSQKPEIGDFAVWRLEKLHECLLLKHNETFWVAAESRMIDGREHFTYSKVEHTQRPILPQFDLLLGQGKITVDHLIKRKPNGSVVEKGPIFKLAPGSMGLLFPPSHVYLLS